MAEARPGKAQQGTVKRETMSPGVLAVPVVLAAGRSGGMAHGIASDRARAPRLEAEAEASRSLEHLTRDDVITILNWVETVWGEEIIELRTRVRILSRTAVATVEFIIHSAFFLVIFVPSQPRPGTVDALQFRF